MKKYTWWIVLSELAVLAVWSLLIWGGKKCGLDCNIADLALSLLTIMGSILAAYIAWYQWRNSCEVKRAETLMELLKVFKEDDLCRKIHGNADDESTTAMEVWYNKAINIPESKERALGSVRFICYLEYLRGRKLIGDREEILFRSTVDAIVNNEWFQRFVKGEASISDEIKQTILKMCVRVDGKNETSPQIVNIDTQGDDSDDRTSCDEINTSEFTDNAMIIKINQKYHSGITDKELYEATRGWWRVNVDNAKKMKFVLSVAKGVVREVYDDINWCETDEESGRSAFKGNATTDAYWRKFVGKSVKKLFKPGESNPVKYFYGK